MSSTAGPTPTARFVRGWLCAALATFLAAASHAVAGGSVPVVATVIALALSGLVCVILAGRRLSLGRVALGVGISQTAFHTLFDLLQPLPGGSLHTAAGAEAVGAGHHHETLMSLSSMTGSADAMAMMTGPGLGMTVSHLVAGLMTVALIRHGESLWWALVSILGASIAMIVALIRVYPVADVRHRLASDHRVQGLYELLHCDLRLRLRGPPMVEPVLA